MSTRARASSNKKRWYRSPKLLRHGVMLFFFLFLLHVAYDHQLKGGGPRGTPSVEAYCPFGGLESLYQFLTTGGFLRRIEPSAMILFGALSLLTLFASRGFCGWVCPFGSVQEWLGWLGRKLFGKRFNPTGVWDRRLRYLKYAVLAVIIALTWWSGTLVFRDYDPFLAFFHLGYGIDELPWAYAILVGVLLGSLYIERFFCKYACPLGAVLGLLSKIGLTRIEREPAGCKECNRCQQSCHAHVDFLSVTQIRDAECNHCLDCVVDCPKPNVLRVRAPRLRLSHSVYAAVLVFGLFGLIGASQLAGKWQTRQRQVAFTGNLGKLDPEAIRGWMHLQEISTGYGIPLEQLYRATGLPARVPATARLNRIARDYQLEFSPESVRETVRRFLAGQPLDEQKSAAKPSQPRKKEGAKGAGQKGPPSGEEPDVRGFMTLNEIALKTGVPKEYLIQALKLPESIDPRQPVREWMHGHGKTIQDFREAVKRYRAAQAR